MKSREISPCLFMGHYGLYNQPHQDFILDEIILLFSNISMNRLQM
jgi:hypothetical protein